MKNILKRYHKNICDALHFIIDFNFSTHSIISNNEKIIYWIIKIHTQSYISYSKEALMGILDYSKMIKKIV